MGAEVPVEEGNVYKDSRKSELDKCKSFGKNEKEQDTKQNKQVNDESTSPTNVNVHIPTPVGSVDINPSEDTKSITITPTPVTGATVAQNSDKSFTPITKIQTPEVFGLASASINFDLRNFKVTVSTSANVPGVSVDKEKTVVESEKGSAENKEEVREDWSSETQHEQKKNKTYQDN